MRVVGEDVADGVWGNAGGGEDGGPGGEGEGEGLPPLQGVPPGKNYSYNVHIKYTIFPFLCDVIKATEVFF